MQMGSRKGILVKKKKKRKRKTQDGGRAEGDDGLGLNCPGLPRAAPEMLFPVEGPAEAAAPAPWGRDRGRALSWAAARSP